MVNFNIVEGAPNRWEGLIEPFMELYQKGVKIDDIMARLELSQNEYRHLLHYGFDNDLISKRKKSKKRKPKGRQGPFRNYTTTSLGYFKIYYKRVYYCTVKREEDAIEVVRRLRECNWDKSQVARIKREVCGC